MPHVLVYGGSGALGRNVVDTFAKDGWTVTNVDLSTNEATPHNIVLKHSSDLHDTPRHVEEALSRILDSLVDTHLDAIINVAGGWAGGNVASHDIYKTAMAMYTQSTWTALVTAHLATKFLRTGGTLVLTGAAAAVDPTPGMVGYGMAKAAVHHLVKSIAAKDGGLPEKAKVVAILPVTLDTPMNRKFMPDADTSSWTPLPELSTKFLAWATGHEQVTTGSLVKVVTAAGKTTFTPL
ncbi:hypothetical protein SmJEL517_g06024 [Synchytrium microbalum]|uniref:Dihydropteridine reductase n=1 Tax=Synchytrium microbalum TaxID=1806994 RepID=A0A507BRS1_9FUNG|nr:uncharacterized protein SmJEL517_g06024 [Synchytrium microbalum]TPX30412.1 hypothetical protein SmJEL517_g06024 [Synchytrium microbalum]